MKLVIYVLFWGYESASDGIRSTPRTARKMEPVLIVCWYGTTYRARRELPLSRNRHPAAARLRNADTRSHRRRGELRPRGLQGRARAAAAPHSRHDATAARGALQPRSSGVGAGFELRSRLPRPAADAAERGREQGAGRTGRRHRRTTPGPQSPAVGDVGGRGPAARQGGGHLEVPPRHRGRHHRHEHDDAPVRYGARGELPAARAGSRCRRIGTQ